MKNDLPGAPVSGTRNPRRWTKWLCVCVVLGCTAGGVTYATRNFWSPKRFGVVVPGLVYRSGQISRWVIGRTLRQNQIKVIVDLTKWEPQNKDQQFETNVSQKLGISHVRCGLNGDGTGELNHFVAALQVLHECEQKKIPVLVHCAAGAQRTGAVVAAYQLLYRGEEPAKIIREMERFGFNATRHRALLAYLDRNLPEIAERLKKAGALPQVPAELPRLVSYR